MRSTTMVLAVLAACLAAKVHGAVLDVKADGTGSYPTIQAAIDAAAAGDEVVLQPGTYTGTGNRDIDFKGKAITVRSTDPRDPAVVAATVVDCEGTYYDHHRGFLFVSGEGGDSVLSGLTVRGGFGATAGGGARCEGASPTIEYCHFADNSAAYSAYYANGGIYCSGGQPLIRSCRFTGNHDAISCYQSAARVIACVFTDNEPYWERGVLYAEDCSPTVTQCIFWNNERMEIKVLYGTPQVTYSVVQDGYEGEGNLSADPRLRSDGHLMADSPCINAGDPAYAAAGGETDFDGEARIAGGRVDIGPDEWIDTDADGLPDWWESRYFGSPTAGVADADPDGDWVITLDEYNRGTDPTVAGMNYHVDPLNGDDSFDGLSPTNTGTHGPKKTIQSAIDAASADGNDHVVLAQGTYSGAGNRGIDTKGKMLIIRSTNPDDPSVVAATVVDGLDLAPGFSLGSYSCLAGVSVVNVNDMQNSRAAIYCTGSEIIVRGCRVINNSHAGMGIYGSASIDSCLVVGNSGSGIQISTTTGSNARLVSIRNTTVAGNGTALNVFSETLVVARNSIFGDGLSLNGFAETEADIAYCFIPSGFDGPGNLDGDPGLRPDGHLRSDSVCINAGDPAFVAAPGQRDLDGEPRVSGGRVDIGYDEFVDSDADGLPDWWETQEFGSATAADAAGDPDGDTLTNLEEYNRATDPHAASPTYRYHVDPAAGDDAWDGLAPAWNGTSGPKRTIQAAVDAVPAEAIEPRVVLDPATYTGDGNRDIDFGGKVLTLRSTDPSDPAVVAATVIDCQGTSEVPHRAFVFQNGEGPDSAVLGVTILNGYALAKDGYRRGGAIACFGTSPTIDNCVIRQCTANQGGAIYCANGSPVLRNCRLADNIAEYGSGSAVYGSSSNARLFDCVITGNSGYSGALYWSGGSPRLSGCIIENNDGGAAYLSYGQLTAVGCLIRNNGDGMYFSGQTVLRNCTIVGNGGGSDGGAFEIGNGSVRIENSVFSENGASPIQTRGYTCTATYCLGTGLAGEGNLEVDPGVLPDGHLRSDSPCIDAGDPAYVAALGEKDMDGEQRVANGRVDIGADEWHDSDGDSLPDWWEAKWFGSATAAATGADDPDGDGFDNEAEYNRQSNPLMGRPTYYVDPAVGDDAYNGLAPTWDGTNGPKRTIQAAVDEVSAVEGGDVVLQPGTYTGDGNRDINPAGKAMTIRATGTGTVTIDCQGTEADPHRGFLLNNGEGPDTVISGLTIINGNAPRMQTGSGSYGYDGSAIGCTGASPTIRNCVFRSNDTGSADIYCYESSPTVTGCTFIAAQGAYRAIMTRTGLPVLRNCLFSGYGSALYHYDGLYDVAYCLGSGRSGEGNLEGDPRLTPDGHLKGDSPCIDAGDPAYVAAGEEKDMDGEARINGGRIDIGADEWHDSDDDMLPDWWESKWFGSAGAAPGDDPDGDQADNLAEFERGSDPLTPAPTYYVAPAAGDDAWDGLAPAWDGTSGPKRTVQAAIDAAPDFEGASVVLAHGLYTGDGNRDIDLRGKVITVRSADPDDPAVVAATIIDAEGSDNDRHRGFYVHNGETEACEIAGLTIRGGYERGGGGIWCEYSSPTISRCVITNNHSDFSSGSLLFGAYGGSAIGMNGGNATIRGCTIAGNSGAPALYLGGTRHIVADCTITDNESPVAGGLMCGGMDVTVSDCTIAGNTGFGGAGGAYLEGARLRVARCVIRENATSLTLTNEGMSMLGGGLVLRPYLEHSPEIVDCLIESNMATSGGGIAVLGQDGPDAGVAETIVRRCRIQNNYAEYGGGAYALFAGIRMVDCTIEGNTAWSGGAVAVEMAPEVSLEGCALAANEATNEGGAVYAYGSTVVMRSCVLQDGWASRGGAVSVAGGSLSARSCLVSNNYAAGSGGGLSAAAGAVVEVSNCTFLYNGAGSRGGSLASMGATVTVDNSVIWYGIGSGEAISGADVEVAYSVVPAEYAGTGNLHVDPQLTADGRLQPGSPCLNAGDPAFVAEGGETDIDGDARVAGGRVDIGCDESVSGQVPGDIDGDGLVNAVDLLRLARGWGKAEGDAGWDPACDLTGDGAVNAMDLLTLARNWPY